MVRRLGLSFLCLIFTAMTAAAAEPYRRLVNFEWEPIEGASVYELELKQTKKNDKTFHFKVKDAAWNGRLAPGGYMMRLRSLDERGVAGDWGAESPFDVALESARLTSPALKAAVPGQGDSETEVTFQWQPVGGARNYHFEVSTDDGSFKKEEELNDTKISLKLPVAKNYNWKVTGLGAEDNVKSEATSLGEFSVLGSKLENPAIEKPENEFVRELKWKRPAFAESFDVAVQRFNPEQKKWEKVEVFEDVKDNSLPFQERWSGGRYRVAVKAKGPLRSPSAITQTEFKVRNGNRSPAAEFTHEVRKSIDRVNGWYGIASYLVTQIKYSSTDYDATFPAGTSYSAVGGTGRLGLGYFKENAPWGFLGILDMSGFVNEQNKNMTYMSAEFSGVWRRQVGDRGEVRVPVGFYYKEHQVARGQFDMNTGEKNVSYENAAVIGPHVGGEYWYSMTPKVGFQANAHMYLSLMKMKTPNGLDIEPTVSTQFGVLGSYRFNNRMTGLMGYARREDKIRYKSNPADARFAGQVNESSVEGNYINFFAEYNF